MKCFPTRLKEKGGYSRTIDHYNILFLSIIFTAINSHRQKIIYLDCILSYLGIEIVTFSLSLIYLHINIKLMESGYI